MRSHTTKDSLLRRLDALIEGRLDAVRSRRAMILMDLVIAVAVVVIDLGRVWFGGGVAWPSFAVAPWVVSYLCIVFRRVAPPLAFVVSSLCFIGTGLFEPLVPFLVTFFTLVRRQRVLPSVLTLVAALLVGGTSAYRFAQALPSTPGETEGITEPWYTGYLQLVLVWVGVYVAARVAQQLDWWRRELAEVSVQRDRRVERQRIAADLHDVIGHAVTLMILQAAAAESVVEADPAQAKASLGHIRRQGRTAIAELHRTLRVLDMDEPGEMEVRMSSVNALVDSVGAGGREVRLREQGTPVPLAHGVEVSAYRIVQEGLTNASKYGDPAHPVVVELDWRTPGAVRITISNQFRSSGHAPVGSGTGRGLIGMQERARAAGGTLDVTHDDANHRVIATLPTNDTTIESPGTSRPKVVTRDIAAPAPPGRVLRVDAAMAAVLGVAEFAVMQHMYVVEEFTLVPPPESAILWAPYLLTWAGSYIALAFRRIAPRLVSALTGLFFLLAGLSLPFGPDELLPIAFLISLFTLARLQRLLPSLAILLVAVALGATDLYLISNNPLEYLSDREVFWRDPDPWWTHSDVLLVWVGVYVAARVAQQLDWWRRELAEVSVQRDRQVERQRIAADLHDVIGHAVTLMILQAAAAESVVEADPAQAKASLGHIRRQGRTAIAELHRTLRVLDMDEPGEMEVRMSSVNALVDSVGAGGREVRLREQGTPVPLAHGVEVSAYRIVQEGLTNASKYGDPAHPVVVELDWRTPGAVRITISNQFRSSGHAPVGSGTGRGLIGMQERARAAGGTLDVTHDDANHRVIATLPTNDTTIKNAEKTVA